MPDRIPTNINDIIHEVLVLIKPSLNEHSIILQLELEDDIPIVLTQHIQIDQVILNLVKNAIEAMSTNSSSTNILQIKTEMTDNENVKVSISDSGNGVDETILKRLFTPFATSKNSGMGLGLSISEGIINEHGGKLKLKTSSYQGSVFQFTLPVH